MNVHELIELSRKIEKMEEENRRLREALEKIADPRKRHKEPGAYTDLGCVMKIANEALAKELYED